MRRNLTISWVFSSACLLFAAGASAHGGAHTDMERAQAAEDKHRFELAEHHLRRILQRNPRDAQAWLKLASLETVRGEMDDAREACAKATRFTGLLVSVACRGRIALAGGEDKNLALGALMTALAHDTVSSRRDPIASWASGVAAELAVALGQTTQADKLFARALADSPAVHLEAAYLDHLLASDRAPAVLDYVDPQDRELARELRRVLALKALQRTEGYALSVQQNADLLARITSLDSVFHHWIEEGDFTHGREMAMFYLHVLPNAELARLTATQNLQHQQEVEDQRLYQAVQALAPGHPATDD